VQAVSGPIDPPAGRTDFDILATIGRVLGVPGVGETPNEVRSAMAVTSDIPGLPGDELPADGVRWGVNGPYGEKPETADGHSDLTIPSCGAPELLFDPRWTDSAEVRFARLVEKAGLLPHVVRRFRVRT
jgi:hypothetical protein